MRIDELRAAYTAETRRADRDACPAADELAGIVAGGVGGARRDALADHVAECADCAEEMRVLLAMHRDEAAPGAARVIPLYRRALGAVAVAAAAALIAIVAWPRADGEAPAPPVYRTTDELAIRSLAASSLARDALLLKWSSTPGARYSVTVATTDLRPLARASDLDESQWTVPAAALDGVRAGDQVVWHVVMTLPDGRAVRSPAFLARIE